MLNESELLPKKKIKDFLTISEMEDDNFLIGCKDISTNTGFKISYSNFKSNTESYVNTEIINILKTLYPVGAIYITTNATCPLSALFGTWQLVGADRVLQGAGTRGTVGTTLDESLPNITGTITANDYFLRYNSGRYITTGSLTVTSTGASGAAPSSGSSGTGATVGCDASLSSSTYQDNAPVQPDAYLVNIFKRTA